MLALTCQMRRELVGVWERNVRYAVLSKAVNTVRDGERGREGRNKGESEKEAGHHSKDFKRVGYQICIRASELYMHVLLHFRVQVWVRVLKAEIVRSFPRLKQLSHIHTRYNIFCFWLRNRSSITVHLRVFRESMVMLLSSLGWMANVLATLLEQISFLGNFFGKCGKFASFRKTPVLMHCAHLRRKRCFMCYCHATLSFV